MSRTCHRILLGLVEERERLRSSTTPVPMLVLMLDVLTSPGVPVGGAGGAAPCLCKSMWDVKLPCGWIITGYRRSHHTTIQFW